MLLLTAKNISIFFGLVTLAFCVSTIVLAIKKSNLEEELQDALHKLDTFSSLTTPARPTSTYSTVLTSTERSSVSSLPNSTATEPTNTVTSSGESIFPTLPTGLPNPEKIVYRLPTDIRPIKYKVYIHPDLKTKTCKGSVSIQIEIDKETNLIVLHAKHLEIHSMSILNMMARMRIRIRKFYLDVEREMFFIELDEILFTATPYVVSLGYRCQMDGLQGFYLSSYVDADNNNR